MRQKLAWMTDTRPDICASVNLASQVTEGKWTRKDVKDLNKTINHVQLTPRKGLLQQKLHKESLCMKVFADSSFANTPSLHSQLGFLVLLCDASGKANIINFCSYKSKRVVHSVMGGE